MYRPGSRSPHPSIPHSHSTPGAHTAPPDDAQSSCLPARGRLPAHALAVPNPARRSTASPPRQPSMQPSNPPRRAHRPYPHRGQPLPIAGLILSIAGRAGAVVPPSPLPGSAARAAPASVRPATRARRRRCRPPLSVGRCRRPGRPLPLSVRPSATAGAASPDGWRDSVLLLHGTTRLAPTWPSRLLHRITARRPRGPRRSPPVRALPLHRASHPPPASPACSVCRLRATRAGHCSP